MTLAINETREISYNLRPFRLDRVGLTKATEGLVQSVAAATAIDITARSRSHRRCLPGGSAHQFLPHRAGVPGQRREALFCFPRWR